MNRYDVRMNERAYEVAKLHKPNIPGKFERETKATVYYWECWMDGAGETVSDCTFFEVEPDEAATFDLPVGSLFAIREDDNGFAYGWTLSDAERENLVREEERIAESEAQS